MSWKSVELQVALPRTQDAGKLQELQTKHHQRFQESLAENQIKQAEIKMRQVNDLKESNQAEINDDDSDERKHSQNQQNKEGKKEKQEDTIDHPYLGNMIDYSG